MAERHPKQVYGDLSAAMGCALSAPPVSPASDLTCLGVTVGLVGWDAPKRDCEHIQAPKVLGGVHDVPAVQVVKGQSGGRPILHQGDSVPASVSHVGLSQAPLHLPCHTRIRRKMHSAVLDLQGREECQQAGGTPQHDGQQEQAWGQELRNRTGTMCTINSPGLSHACPHATVQNLVSQD